MCFSEEASFTAGIVLSVMGLMTIKRVKTKSRLLIASIPLLFGMHQLMEGFIWRSLNEFSPDPMVVLIFLIFAWIIWPIFVPLSFLTAEVVPWKRKLFACCVLLGVIIALCDIRFLYLNEVTPQIIGSSLYYDHSPAFGNYAFGAASLIPIFLSSIPGMRVFAWLLLVSFLSTQLIYFLTFTSVWCFFCAVLSISLFKILTDAEKIEIKQPLRIKK